MKGKTTFTRQEADQIIALIRKKLVSNTNDKKSIRNKIRQIGFYASDFNVGNGYNEHDFLRVVNIVGEKLPLSNNFENKKEATPSNELKIEKNTTSIVKRSNSDEFYVLDICDKILGIASIRQHRFDFLRGDSGSKLPVDAYCQEINLVVEFKEKQHTEKVGFFDKRMTVSGIGRGEQRARYDQLRREILPKNGIDLIEFDYSEFEHTRSKKLLRNNESDAKVIFNKLKKYLKGANYDK